MLHLHDIDASIEGVHVLRGVNLHLPPGATAALIGRNGAGKTTLLRTVMGFVRLTRGQIMLADQPLHTLPAHQRPGCGIGYAPEDRRLFASFNVEDNLRLPAQVQKLPAAAIEQALARVYELLPELAELRNRPAGSVSGGQGKMVALGRALMIGTRLVLLDEPFQGLAPALALRYAETLHKLREKDRDLTLLITESNPALLKNFAEEMFEIERGEVQLTEDNMATL